MLNSEHLFTGLLAIQIFSSVLGLLLVFFCCCFTNFSFFLFFSLFGCTTENVGSEFPDQGSNLLPRQRKWVLIHWTAGEVHHFFNWQSIQALNVKLNYFLKLFACLSFSFSKWLLSPDWRFLPGWYWWGRKEDMRVTDTQHNRSC